jgi:uncharacterized Tic20 family protein
VRVLAASCHFGLYAALLILHLTGMADGCVAPRCEAVHGAGAGAAALWVLVLGCVLGPPLAALWAARNSPWRGFLRVHAGRVLAARVAVTLWVGGAILLTPLLERLPLVALILPVALTVVLLAAWFILPMGAGFRALEGAEPWYPLVARLAPSVP